MSQQPIKAPHLQTLVDGRHFTAGSLRRAFAAGLGAAARLRAIGHFGRMRCAARWRLLDELGSLEPGPLPAEGPDVAFDPVLAALRRLVTASHDPGTVDQLRPAHGHWLRRCQLEAIGFFRLLVEESRQYGLEHAARGLAAAQEAFDLLERLPLEAIGSPWIALKTLAQVYLGDMHRVAGQHRLAFEHLKKADQEWLQSSGDTELYLTWHEMKAELALDQGQLEWAGSLAGMAMELVHEVEIEGRMAETLILLGRVWLGAGDGHAAGPFDHALQTIPAGKHHELRQRAFQHLALAKVMRRRFADAEEYLAMARMVGARHSSMSPLLRAERLWVEGLLHLETGRYDEAEVPLRQSLERFCQLGLMADAAQALANLARVYVVRGQTEKLLELEREYGAVLQAPTTRGWIESRWQRVARWAERHGVLLTAT